PTKLSFVGRVATITLGSARLGQPAQAKLQDQHGQTHYVMVEPDRQDITFEQGSRVLLVARARGVFRAIKNKNNALID
ncbi:MAG: OB-fold-containig protein, partial [Pseudomonadota bacterium]